jgi:hypothetical protein
MLLIIDIKYPGVIANNAEDKQRCKRLLNPIDGVEFGATPKRAIGNVAYPLDGSASGAIQRIDPTLLQALKEIEGRFNEIFELNTDLLCAGLYTLVCHKQRRCDACWAYSAFAGPPHRMRKRLSIRGSPGRSCS